MRSDKTLGADPGRRRFLRGAALAIPGATLLSAWPMSLLASTERKLSFHHTHTGENISIVYHDGADYIPESLADINQYLRDFRTGEAYPMDPALLDLLHAVRAATGGRGTFDVISGYRSPATNAKLRGKSNGVAKRSLHMQGKAIDVRLSGVDTVQLRKAGLALAGGGVGYYQKSDFLHLDTGRVRSW